MNQKDLQDYLSDPETIKQAVEGSMEKRLKVMNPDNTDPLDKILLELDINPHGEKLLKQQILDYIQENYTPTADLSTIVREARIDELKLMQGGDVEFQRYSEDRIAELNQVKGEQDE
jgi:hypothetical protein